jgi:hypothetical protein
VEVSSYFRDFPLLPRACKASKFMSGPLRSKQGCWTCKLRKKKCDEGRPHCSTCHLLSINCYGYGPKPDWMDNGERERTVANGIKETIKHTSRRKTTTRIATQRDPILRIAPKSTSGAVDNSSSSTGASTQDHVTPPSEQRAPEGDGNAEIPNESNVRM